MPRNCVGAFQSSRSKPKGPESVQILLWRRQKKAQRIGRIVKLERMVQEILSAYGLQAWRQWNYCERKGLAEEKHPAQSWGVQRPQIDDGAVRIHGPTEVWLHPIMWWVTDSRPRELWRSVPQLTISIIENQFVMPGKLHQANERPRKGSWLIHGSQTLRVGSPTMSGQRRWNKSTFYTGANWEERQRS